MSQSKEEKFTTVIATIFVVLLFITLGLSTYRNSQYKDSQSLLNATQDSLKIWKDKEGKQHGRIQALETQTAEDFIKLKTKDEEIIRLQKLVKKNEDKLKNGGSVTIVDSETEIDTVFETLIIKGDNIYPTYLSKINLDNWIAGEVVASPDTTKVNIKINNKYSVVIGEDKVGRWPFRTKEAFVEVTNENPYTNLKTVKTWTKAKPRDKKFSIGPSISYGIGSNFTFQPFIGVSVQYSVIKF